MLETTLVLLIGSILILLCSLGVALVVARMFWCMKDEDRHEH